MIVAAAAATAASSSNRAPTSIDEETATLMRGECRLCALCGDLMAVAVLFVL